MTMMIERSFASRVLSIHEEAIIKVLYMYISFFFFSFLKYIHLSLVFGKIFRVVYSLFFFVSLSLAC